MKGVRFCPYCRNYKPDKGFKFVLHPSSGSKRGQCPGCQATRKLPRERLEEMARQDGEDRRTKLSEAVKASYERKRNDEKSS